MKKARWANHAGLGGADDAATKKAPASYCRTGLWGYRGRYGIKKAESPLGAGSCLLGALQTPPPPKGTGCSNAYALCSWL